MKLLRKPSCPWPTRLKKPKAHGGSWIRILVYVLLISGLGFIVWRIHKNQQLTAQNSANQAAELASQPIPVQVSAAEQKPMPVFLTALGTVTPYMSVTVKARVSGELLPVKFTEGQQVRQGQTIMVIDPKPYQAALDQAKGNLLHDEALLKNAQAEYARYQSLFAAGVVSKETLDADEAAQGQYQGAIAADKAAIETAQLQLDWCSIQSPIDGRIGLRLVDPGNVITANTTNLVIINQFQPIAVYFTLPENELPAVMHKLAEDKRLLVDAYDRNDTTKLASGYLLTGDNQIDTTTGTEKLKAVFENHDQSLFPNQFVNIHLVLENRPRALVIPSAAIQSGIQGPFVWISDSTTSGSTTARIQPVKIALTEGQYTILDSGLDAGQQVVVDGADRLHNGQAIVATLTQPAPPASLGNAGNARGRQSNTTRDKATVVSLSPSRPFILRPVATSLLMVAIMLTGIIGYRQLPVSALPEVDYPIIQVLTFYPGGGPEVMASSVTAPLERQFGEMPGLKQMTSVSSGGGSVITLEFNLDENIDVAEQEVQASINAANSFLPTDLPNPPIYSKVNPADAPIMTLALTSDSLPLDKIEDAADTNLAQKISQVTGVGLVSIAGGQKPSVRIQANPAQLAAYNLSLEDLRSAVAAANVDQAKGTLNGVRQAFTINANDQLLSSSDYKPVIVAYRNGAAVRASDVATIVDAAENSQQAAWMDREPAVIVNIQRQPGANIIAVVDRIKKLLPQLQSSLPAAVKVKVLTDRTITIRASVKDVEYELMLTVALVVMVIFLFLRNLAATIIPSVAVPLSIVGTFGVMYLLGYSLNNLTLMALTISTGFVVDDAIVMIENISRYIEEGSARCAPHSRAANRSASPSCR